MAGSGEQMLVCCSGCLQEELSEGRILAVSREVKSWATDLAACLGGFQADIAFLLSWILCFGGHSKKAEWGYCCAEVEKSGQKMNVVIRWVLTLSLQHLG